METAFTPWTSLSGGVLIGLAAVALMALYGRILGATGILGGLIFPPSRDEWAWRAALVAGMATGPAVYWFATGRAVAIQVPVSTGALILGGLIVGVGVSYSSGCTSGHGVCGLARLSPRSVVATLTFMLTTGITVFVVRHGAGG